MMSEYQRKQAVVSAVHMNLTTMWDTGIGYKKWPNVPHSQCINAKDLFSALAKGKKTNKKCLSFSVTIIHHSHCFLKLGLVALVVFSLVASESSVPSCSYVYTLHHSLMMSHTHASLERDAVADKIVLVVCLFPVFKLPCYHSLWWTLPLRLY